MSDEEGQLRAAIRARPEEDDARRVFADWLSQRGDPRGAFIALSLAPPSPERDAAMRALWEAHHRGWSAGLGAAGVRKSAWHRGFPRWIVLNMKRSGEHLSDLLERDPIIGLKVNGAKANWEALLESSELHHLSHLSLIGGGLGQRRVKRLGEHPEVFASVTCLNLGRNAIGRAAPALASLRLPALRRLDLHDNGLGDEGLRCLLDAPWMTRITHLNVGFNQLSDAGVEALARHPALAAVEHLDLWDPGLTSRAFESLAGSTSLKAWRSYGLHGLPPEHRAPLDERGIVTSPVRAPMDLQEVLPRDFALGI